MEQRGERFGEGKAQGKAPGTSPDAIYYRGKILTMNPANPTATAEAVAVKGGRIVAVGDERSVLALAGEGTEKIDLEGRTLLPGFIDSHGHFPWNGNDELYGVKLYSPPIGTIRNIDELLAALKAKARTLAPGEWILGRGYDDSLLEDRRHPTRHDLDQVSTTSPVFLVHISAHVGVANSVALKMAGLTRDTADLDGGFFRKDSHGELNGILEGPPAYTTVQNIIPARTETQDLAGIRKACEIYAAAGVTTAQNGWAFYPELGLLKKACASGDLFLRVVVWPFASSLEEMTRYPTTKSGTDLTDNHMVTLGAAKLWADGSIYVYTAWLSQPYHTPPEGKPHYRGYSRFKEKAQLIHMIKELHSRGWQTAIHTIGDQATQDALEGWAAAQEAMPRADARHICNHAHLAREDQLERMKELGITPSFFVTHTYFWGDRHRDIFVGPDRAKRLCACRTALDRGLRITFHNDTPVTPISPLMSVWSAVNRLTSSGKELGPELRIMVPEALRAVTIDAAWQNFEEGIKGSIEVGKLADFAVLEENPLEVDPLKIKDIRVVRTIVGGRTVFEA
ncbi:MAG: amidohydrolase [Syntrophobacteraceae bacterium]|nr:amidohydrolase [Desulfobacteraceae bacterium]